MFGEVQYRPATNFRAPGILLGMSSGLQRFKLVRIAANRSSQCSQKGTMSIYTGGRNDNVDRLEFQHPNKNS